jgi:hypothetical protein
MLIAGKSIHEISELEHASTVTSPVTANGRRERAPGGQGVALAPAPGYSY